MFCIRMLHFESLLLEKVTIIVFYLNLSLCTQIPARVFFVWLFKCTTKEVTVTYENSL